MLRTLIEARALVVLIVAAATGLWGTQTYPVSRDDVFLGLIAEHAPDVWRSRTTIHIRTESRCMTAPKIDATGGRWGPDVRPPRGEGHKRKVDSRQAGTREQVTRRLSGHTCESSRQVI